MPDVSAYGTTTHAGVPLAFTIGLDISAIDGQWIDNDPRRFKLSL